MLNYNNMSTVSRVCSKDLKYNKDQLKEIDKWIRDILHLIDEKIEEAHNNGVFKISYPLPSSFDISNMKSKEARRRIHAKVIGDLACPERGFIIRYVKLEKKYYVDIKWMSDVDLLETQKEYQILNYYNLSEVERKDANQKPHTERYLGLNSLLIME